MKYERHKNILRDGDCVRKLLMDLSSRQCYLSSFLTMVLCVVFERRLKKVHNIAYSYESIIIPILNGQETWDDLISVIVVERLDTKLCLLALFNHVMILISCNAFYEPVKKENEFGETVKKKKKESRLSKAV